MRTPKHSPALYQLEVLESRTLLAALDPVAALSVSGGYLINFAPATTGSLITIAGTAAGDLSIDATLLPDWVKDLNISGFNRVTITGSEQLNSLTLGRVGTFSGLNTDVVTLNATNVGTISLHAVTVFATLAGKEMRLEVFDSRSANIYSTLDKLTVASSNDVFLISGNSNQEIRLDFRTANLPLGPTQNVIFPAVIPAPRPSEIPAPPREIPAPPSEIPAPPSEIPTSSSGVPISPEGIPSLPDEIRIGPEDIQPDTVRTFNGTTYTVVVLSLSNAKDGQLLKLQIALEKGDLESVRSFFVTHLKSNRLSNAAYSIRLPASTPEELYLAEFSRVVSLRNHDANFVDQRMVVNLVPQMGDAYSAKLPLFESQENLRAWSSIESYASSKIAARELPTEFNLEPIILAPDSIQYLDPADATHDLNSGPSPILDFVRSILAEGVDFSTNTVSAYIIGHMTDELQPGESPGLLVDAKPTRQVGDRESTWIQV
jgi:hypothetical protein